MIFFLRLNAIVKFSPSSILLVFRQVFNANKRVKRRQAVITTDNFSLFQKSDTFAAFGCSNVMECTVDVQCGSF
jgi:hypothetical protein